MSNTIAEIVLDRALDQPLDYLIPEEMQPLKIGVRVEVKLRGKSALGYVLSYKSHSPYTTLKPISRKLSDEPLITPDLLNLAQWISKYYCASLTRVLKSMIPPPLRDESRKEKTTKYLYPNQSQNQLLELCHQLRRKSPSQAKVIDVLLKFPKGVPQSQLLEEAKVTTSPLQSLIKKEIIRAEDIQVQHNFVFDHPFFETKPKTLNSEQQQTLEKILDSVNTFASHLIHGVTGSGKTEIYLQAIQNVIESGKSVIYLVPEIALTSQTIERFKSRFGNHPIAVLHHRRSEQERFEAWQQIRAGKIPIVIGARSAIFSPCPNLGLIVVDEEHEGAFKQSEEGPKYHARDIAVLRAKMASCPVLLGSATPSLESYYNALSGKYQLHTLKNRADSASMPSIHIIDMKREFEKAKGFVLFSDPLIQKLDERLKRGEQALLFLNRRGYHTQAQCEKCGYRVTCPHCAINLTYHLKQHSLSCHLCDHRMRPPNECPECQAEGPLKFKGVGTEMVEKALHALFPQVRTARLDADTTKHKGQHEKIFKEFRSGKADVLIGTQMIAKGLHFPLVTLVGVLNMDGSLNIPDFRASENAFSLLTQVAGRAGREALSGEVIIQTHLPDHSLIQHAKAGEYEAFYKEEIGVRELFNYPPFSHLVKCSFASEDLDRCKREADAFRSQLIRSLPPEVEIMPVVECGYAKIKKRHRFQCLIKCKRIQTVLPALKELSTSNFSKGKVRFTIDVDPLSTFF